MVTVDKDKKVTGVAPVKSVVRSVLGGTVHLDLSAATFPIDADPMVVDITLLFGRVEIIVPRAWQVRAGRVELARRVWFGGDLDMAEPWSADEDDDVDCVALNVQGLGGAVCLRRS
jgi:hypothetical protein